MHMDPELPRLVAAVAATILIGLTLRRFRQPQAMAYLAVGVLLGPEVFGILTDKEGIARLGEIGVLLLLFFVGMEVSIGRLAAGWRVAVVGTFLQTVVSVALVAALGLMLDWPLARIVLVGFAISLSSTAVVVSLLRSRGELDTEVGQDALGILVVQDAVAMPVMLIVLGFLQGDEISAGTILLQAAGLAAVAMLVWFLVTRETFSLPFGSLLKGDHELQVFSALGLCFGLALVTALLHLSTALGAFLAGMVVAGARETDWVHRTMEPFRVVLVALFFVSVGMLMELQFIVAHRWMLLLLVLAAFTTNTFINAGILRVLGRRWFRAMYVSALLAQIGEFSFVLAAVGRQAGIIEDFAYQMTINVIALTLLLSPAWIALLRPFTRARPGG